MQGIFYLLLDKNASDKNLYEQPLKMILTAKSISISLKWPVRLKPCIKIKFTFLKLVDLLLLQLQLRIRICTNSMH